MGSRRGKESDNKFIGYSNDASRKEHIVSAIFGLDDDIFGYMHLKWSRLRSLFGVALCGDDASAKSFLFGYLSEMIGLVKLGIGIRSSRRRFRGCEVGFEAYFSLSILYN